MKLDGVIIGAALAALLASGCVSEAPDEDQVGHVSMKRPASVTYEQIDAGDMKLEPVGELRLTAGTPGVISIQLTNHGIKDVQIPEWYMVDQYNFAVYYRRLPDDRPVDPAAPYQCYRVKIPFKPRPVHSELQLKPHNRALMTVTLPFISELAPGEKAEFQVYVATALMTFKIQTAPFTVMTQ